MKTIKTILIAATLICASVVSTLSAQQSDSYKWNVSIGDSVMIKRDCVKYLTGEQPSTWVYDKVHTVRQLGTKRFPEGVLLMNIYSWVCEECIGPVNPKAAPKAADKPAPAQEQKKEEVAQDKAPEVAPVEEDKQDNTEAGQEAAPAPAPAPAPANVEQVKGDSMVSKQDFRHHYDRFTIGVRGGASALLHKVNQGKWTCGGDVLLDLQYAHYWQKDGRPVDLGIITGLSLGYSASGMKASVDTRNKVVVDQDGDHIVYNVRADEIKENDAQLQLEIPLMFGLIHNNGLFFNAGARFMLPVYTPYNQKISDNPNTFISAEFQEAGIKVTNEVVTGKLAETDYKTKGTDNGNQFAFNLMLGAELGYEWTLKSGNSLGLGAYFDYCVFSTFKNNNVSENPLIQVTPPTTSNAIVEVSSATKTYAQKLGFFDAGVKLAYHFNFPKKRKAAEDAALF
jgi:hypothetical protein